MLLNDSGGDVRDVRSCSLMPTQPQAREAQGEAHVKDSSSEVCIVIRGLVHPSYFGRDLATGGSFNIYDVWLCDSCSGHRICLGSLRREGAHWRIRRRVPVQVDQFDQVLVTAEHDSCPLVSSDSVVMVGCCCGIGSGC